ncbi:hypothetical protein FB45DRAFT_742956, partial [Roridomyces roridus]
TPSKRMRILGAELAATSSGAFLVTKPKATHLQICTIPAPAFERIPDELREPDWTVLDRLAPLPLYRRNNLESRCQQLETELADARHYVHAHQAISQGQNAQLIVQNMTMGKLKHALFEKEKGKNGKKGRTVLFPGGLGRHLTSDEVIAQQRALENEKEKEATDKVARQARRAERKAEKERIEEEWKVIRAEHEVKVKAWEERVLALKLEGKRGKDLPNRPKRPPKPKPKESDDENDDDDGRSQHSDGGGE